MRHDNDSEKLDQLLRFHLENHQDVGVQDIYKCIFQGVCGAEHLLTDVAAARGFLQKEWQDTEPAPEALLLEPVSLDMIVFRLNLAPYKAMGGTWEHVFKIFQRSVQNFHFIPNRTAELWQEFVALCKSGKFSFPLEEVMQFTLYLIQNNYPVHHHSQSYREKNKPAYRLIQLTELFSFE